jgi:hypothetical protein
MFCTTGCKKASSKHADVCKPGGPVNKSMNIPVKKPTNNNNHRGVSNGNINKLKIYINGRTNPSKS